MSNHYDTLKVSRNASKEDIKRSYKRLALEFHPDVNPGSNQLVTINEAYSILINDEKRAQYDYGLELLKLKNDNNCGFKEAVKSVEISIKESIFGCQYAVFIGDIERSVCNNCNGKRSKHDRKMPCNSCLGTGKQTILNHNLVNSWIECELCHGFGDIPLSPCARCNGSGLTNSDRYITVNIPPGIPDRQHLSFNIGQSNLIIEVRIAADANLKRIGLDLHLDIDLNLVELLKGGVKRIANIYGDETNVDIPVGMTIGRTILKVRGFGIRYKQNQGDLYLNPRVKLPTQLTPEIELLLEKLKGLV